MADSSTAAVIDVIIKGIALLGTGAFFAYKTLSGFNNQNMSLSLETRRIHQEDEAKGHDIVHCKIMIEKGTTAALALEGLEARFVWGQAQNESKQVAIQVCRLEIAPSADPRQLKVSQSPDAYRPFLYLSPGEKTSFECIAAVPKDAICEVDVVAFGRRRVAATTKAMPWSGNTFQAQWRASAVVLEVQDKLGKNV